MPRYKDATPKDVSAIESWLHWKETRKQGNRLANCTLEKWCGIKWKDMPSKDYRDFYSKYYKPKYYHWDTERKYPSNSIMQDVGYWRKANQIHNWFVNNVQNEIDDCCFHDEVTKEKLLELYDICHEVMCNSKLINGQVANGYSCDADGNKVYNWEP